MSAPYFPAPLPGRSCITITPFHGPVLPASTFAQFLDRERLPIRSVRHDDVTIHELVHP